MTHNSPIAPQPSRDDLRWALISIDAAKRTVMDLYGGNLDHPALDHLDAAAAEVKRVHKEVRDALQ